jgi:RNA polymerase sigma-70 factor (ECF subfamily)
MADIDPIVEAMLAAGRAEYPDLDVDAQGFAAFVNDRAERMDSASGDLPGADLYLAYACASGDSRAIATLERRHFDEVDRVVAVMRAPEGTADEVKQILRMRFFVADGPRPAAIAEFGGRGDLRGWVRVSAVREVLRLFKRSRRSVALDEVMLGELAPPGDAETDLAKQRVRADVGAALRQALAGLPVRERMLLRYQLVDGLGITAIGSIYHVHRATVARWLAKVRDDLLAETQRLLADRLQLRPDELDSILRFARSQLDISLVSVLGDPEPRS